MNTNKGFTLLMTLLYATAALSIGLGVGILIIGEIGLSGTGRESQLAFYAADFGAECALYWDLQRTTIPASIFEVPPPQQPPYVVSLDCGGNSYSAAYADPGPEDTFLGKYIFHGQLDNGACVDVTFAREPGGGATITALGHNICLSATGRRVERGLEVKY